MEVEETHVSFRGWYAVRFYAMARPNKVWTTVNLFLDYPIEVRTLKQWRTLVPKLRRLEAEGRLPGGLPKLVQNYLGRFLGKFLGVYSIGPFESLDMAIQAGKESADWWRESAHLFLGPEGVPQYEPELEFSGEDQDLDHVTEASHRTLGVIDVTDPWNWVHYPTVTACAKALGTGTEKVSDVCRLRRATVKGRKLRYSDPAGYGVPTIPDGGDGGTFSLDRESIDETPRLYII